MRRQISLHMVQLLNDMDFVAVLNIRNCAYVVSICYDNVPCLWYINWLWLRYNDYW